MAAMQVTATDAAVDVVRRARTARSGNLTITLGTGCCESTAPFLYEDFWPGPDQLPVGSVDGVVVYAPEYLRDLYPGDEGVGHRCPRRPGRVDVDRDASGAAG